MEVLSLLLFPFPDDSRGCQGDEGLGQPSSEMNSDRGLPQPSSEKRPPAVDGNQDRDPQADIIQSVRDLGILSPSGVSPSSPSPQVSETGAAGAWSTSGPLRRY